MNVASTGPAPAEVLLADGTVAVIRGLQPEDRAALLALHDDVCDDSYLLRFFTLGHKSGHDYTAHLFDPTGTTIASLVATVHGEIVALATAEQLTPDTAEIAFLVADRQHGHGAGSLLLEHLAATARRDGIRVFVAEVMHENRAMLRVFADAGFAVTRTPVDNLVRVEMLTACSGDATAAADARESRSEALSLHPLLHPRAVAVVGVRRDGTGIGHAVLQSILLGGFTGTLSLVHPAADTVEGLQTYRRLVDVPGPLDLVIIAVPVDRVVASMTDAAAAGARAVVVISSGFSELGEDGKDLQHAVARIARDAGIRLVGPNCLGILANDPATSLNATFTRARPPYGGLAIGSQSGGVGISLLEVATELNLGVHSFVSLGNKADVSGNDLLSAWFEDPTVTAAALYLESFGNARKFARIGQRFARHKPLLVALGGRSEGGRRAGTSHTAAGAGRTEDSAALLARAGVIPCRSASDIAEAALLLGEQPLPRGGRIAIMSNAGGLGVLAADAADDLGLEVPCLSDPTQALLGTQVSGTVGVSNPVDLGAAATAADLEACIDTVLASGEIDALLIVLIPTQISDPAPFLKAVISARARNPQLPVLMTVTSGPDVHQVELPGVSRFPSYDAALGAYARVLRYAEWLRIPDVNDPIHDDEPAEPRQLAPTR
ncbi:MAG: family N-acetyltransferase [Marmoricola sp.]|nr:family N-acetyltransferase [Marmoricola sp.]